MLAVQSIEFNEMDRAEIVTATPDALATYRHEILSDGIVDDMVGLGCEDGTIAT
jgi:hypothetical protein